MTLLETERLVRKISEVLQQQSISAVAPKLAEDYAVACKAANLRLQQCEAMIKAGDQHQAIQLAETQPNLLDVITMLEFAQADEWRSYCEQRSLAIPDCIDFHAVQTLNDTYGRGISTDHPLYAAYRSAVLRRNDEDALKVLQSITRLNPRDTNAATELTRLDGDVLTKRIDKLAEYLRNPEPATISAEVEAIEAFGFKTQPSGETWRKAQAIRCEWLLREAAQVKSSSRWMDALTKLDLIHRLQSELKMEFSPAVLLELEKLDAWAHGEQDKYQQDRQFQSLIAELRYRVSQSEEKDTSAHYVELPELRGDFEGMHKVWRALTEFTRPIPDDVAVSFKKRIALLEAEIERRTSIRRRMILAGSVVVVGLAGLVAWLVQGHAHRNDFLQTLASAVQQQQARSVEKLLEQARTQDRALLNSAPVNAALANAEEFLRRQRGLTANFERALASLPQKPEGPPDAVRFAAINDQLGLTRNALAALAPDLKSENEPHLQAFERQWNKLLLESATQIDATLEKSIADAETQCSQLDYGMILEKAGLQLAAISNLLGSINACESSYTNLLELRADLLQRTAALQRRYRSFAAEFNKITDGQSGLRTARTVEQFSVAIKLLASSEFSFSPPVKAAAAIEAADTSVESALRHLLGMTNESIWAYLQKTDAPRFVPEIVMPAEKAILENLEADPSVSGVHAHYRLWLDVQGERSLDWITAGLLEESEGWTKISAWAPSAGATEAYFAQQTYGYFNHQYRLSPTQIIYRAQLVDTRDETAAFNGIGLQAVSSGINYQGPMLRVLDALKDSRAGSPLFRAYLFLRLTELIKLQPDAWGLSFCPAVSYHASQLLTALGNNLQSGDWFVSEKASSYNTPLAQLFASFSNVSYMKQASGLFAVAKATSTAGLSYAGYIGLDGKPNLSGGPSSRDLWALGIDGQLKSVSTPSPLMLLSPVFLLGQAPSQILTNAVVDASDPCFAAVLPPLFKN